MKLLIELDEEYVNTIDKIKFLVGGRTDRKLQLEIIKAIKNGKALDQEPRKGHWIAYIWNDNGIARWGIKCDKCHKEYKYGGELWNNPNFCPNCGSDNREVGE